MKNILAVILVAVLFMGIDYSSEAQKTVSQQNQVSLGVQLGVGIPMGDFGDAVNTGFGFQGLFGYALAPSLDLRITAGYFSFGGPEFKEAGGTIETSISDIPLLAGISYKLTKSGVTPYIGAEAGLHYLTTSADAKAITGDEVTISSSSSEFGVGVFAGLMLPVSQKLSVIFDGKFNYIFDSEDAINYVGIHAGIMYNL